MNPPNSSSAWPTRVMDRVAHDGHVTVLLGLDPVHDGQLWLAQYLATPRARQR